jgi:hypothetical protein
MFTTLLSGVVVRTMVKVVKVVGVLVMMMGG